MTIDLHVPLFFQFLQWLYEKWEKRFGHKLSFGEMFEHFEDQERMRKILMLKGFSIEREWKQ